MIKATNKTITARGATEAAKTAGEPTAPDTKVKRRRGKAESKGKPTIASSTDATVIEPATGFPNTAPAPKPPRQTKAALLRARLAEPGGVSRSVLIEATGWQAHTLRAHLSGLRKEGLTVTRRREGDDTIYAIDANGANAELVGDSAGQKAEAAGGAEGAPPEVELATQYVSIHVHDTESDLLAAESNA